MKRLFILGTLLFTSQAFASWDMNQNGVALEPSTNDISSMAILEYSVEENQYYVSFMDTMQLNSNTNCSRSDSVWEINGQLVNVSSMCDRGASRFYGSSDKGREFILNQFKTKNSVKVGNTTYSAMGFTAALKKIKQRKEMEKSAL
ncbi:hypothetical protein [Vibrio harveyi]|uniref:hypothetical protein n=1 Tax=Vibrio harveyi TaxID=669 RepID=UPI003CF15296